ncbi:hypothetical protein FG386_001607 [Cryptosporidium ryanae]|uniref:uncharacterized protein n=1 Tax=Cryptosporidium ryanae TaxID=515981 RepID=UPI00351A3B2B|nr:hypothetical protein FG386_001607 [Cryptosporidium ryanae]
MYDITGSQIEDISFSFVTPEMIDEIIMDDYPHLRLGPSVSQVIMLLVNGFIEDTLKSSYLISKMQSRVEMQPSDILIHLKRKYLNTCFCEFCDFQQSEINIFDPNIVRSEELNHPTNDRISYLTNFEIERLHKVFNTNKRIMEYI